MLAFCFFRALSVKKLVHRVRLPAMSALDTAAADARTLERTARDRAGTPAGAVAALALALGKLCAEEGLNLADATSIATAAHDATRNAPRRRRLDA